MFYSDLLSGVLCFFGADLLFEWPAGAKPNSGTFRHLLDPFGGWKNPFQGSLFTSKGFWNVKGATGVWSNCLEMPGALRCLRVAMNQLGQTHQSHGRSMEAFCC